METVAYAERSKAVEVENMGWLQQIWWSRLNRINLQTGKKRLKALGNSSKNQDQFGVSKFIQQAEKRAAAAEAFLQDELRPSQRKYEHGNVGCSLSEAQAVTSVLVLRRWESVHPELRQASAAELGIWNIFVNLSQIFFLHKQWWN